MVLGSQGLILSVLLVVLQWKSSLSAVNYIIARREESVDTICLGRDPRFAFDWDPAVTYSNLPSSDAAQIKFAGGGAISNANFLYIGSQAGLTEHFCASQMETLLYSPRLSGLFINLQNEPLPGSAGYVSYVTPIWQASSLTRVSLKIVNLVNETWQIISTLPDDPVIDPNSTVSENVPGSFFNKTLESFDMVRDYLAQVAEDRVAYPISTTCGAIIQDIDDGTTAYLFFAVFPGDSRFCTVAGQRTDPALSTVTCVLAHVFEAQYDVSGIDFDALIAFYTGQYRRRLLQFQTREGESGRGFKWQKRRLLATSSTSKSLSGGLRSMTCRILPNRINSLCRSGLRSYPRCALVCTTK